MPLVVDASAVGAAILADGPEGLALKMANAWDGIVHAPVHWPIEVVSLVIKAERTDRITVEQSTEIWSTAVKIIAAARVEPSTDADRLWRLVHDYAISAQDAPYLELALRRGLPLLTGDKQLARACIAADVPLPFNPLA